MKNLKTAILKTAIWEIIICGLFLFSCGPSAEQIAAKKAQAKMRYKVGNVVYLKPDSCNALITGTSVSFDYGGINNWDSGYVVYNIRDCRSIETTTKDEFIYGLKHR
jgi:hypothetical protein